ncbi:MAG: hypothetical protein ACON5N_14120 [Akkermansiaceae bacterium]
MNERLKGRLGSGFWISWGVAMAWSLYRCLTNESWILDDELTHYLISKDVWNDPKELWHPWSRPGRNILQFIPAYFGLTAARVWTLALAGLAIWFTGRGAKRLGMQGLAFLPLLVGFQWWFPELSYPVLTQTPFMVVWIAAMYFSMRDKWVIAALLWGYLPLVRHEGIALSGLWGLWVIFGPGGFARYLLKGKWKDARDAFPKAVWYGFWTCVPLIVMNIASGVMRDEWPYKILFDSKPTEYYGSGSIWLYLRHLISCCGLPVVILMAIGFWKKWERVDWKMLLWLTYPAYFVMHSLIYWKGLFASGGYYHFIMPMAPAIGLVALRGFNILWEKFGPKIGGAVLAVVVMGGLMMPQQQFVVPDSHIEGMPDVNITYKLIAPPMKLSRYATGIKEATLFVREEFEDVPVLAHNIGVTYWLEGNDSLTKLEAWGPGNTPEKVPSGTVFIWDSHNSVDFHEIPLERIENDDWEFLKSFAYDSVRVYRKK